MLGMNTLFFLASSFPAEQVAAVAVYFKTRADAVSLLLAPLAVSPAVAMFFHRQVFTTRRFENTQTASDIPERHPDLCAHET